MHTRPDRRTRRALGATGLVFGLLAGGCQATGVSEAPTAAVSPQRTAADADGPPTGGHDIEARTTPAAGNGRDRAAHRGGVARAAPMIRPARPQRIVVPRLGVDASVVPVVAVDRVLLPPGDPQVIGWWADGARPGAPKGSAVLTGHTVHSGGGAFDELGTLHVGDAVTVVTRHRRLRYAVRSVTAYPKQSLAAHAGEVFSQRVSGRLVLITCEDWNGVTYLSNTVVVARPAW